MFYFIFSCSCTKYPNREKLNMNTPMNINTEIKISNKEPEFIFIIYNLTIILNIITDIKF